jgi:hypothetical protein
LSISRIGRFGPTRILSSRGRFEIASNDKDNSHCPDLN